MGWVKEANKKGKYDRTYEGFRINIIKEPTSSESLKEINGEMYRETSFTKGEYFATDSTGLVFNGWIWDIISKIDKEIMRRKMSKHYGEELEWR